MSATILLKRTLGTSPPNIAPVGTGVSFGELIYTYDTSDVGAGKSYKKLYIGNPAGPTAPPIAVGGEYYTSLFNDNPAHTVHLRHLRFLFLIVKDELPLGQL